MADLTHVDFTAVESEATKALKESEGLFKKLGLHSGSEATLFGKANEAARAAVENSKLTAPDELKTVADTAFRKTFHAEADHLLASKGHGVNVVKSFFRKTFGGAADGVAEMSGYTRGKAGDFMKAPPGRISRGLAWVPNKIGNFAKNNPKLAFFGLAAGAVYAGSRVVASRNEANSQAEYEANMRQVAAMQQAAPQPSAYYGGVTDAEMAAMEAQMRTGGQNGGFAAAEMQRRAAAASVEQAAKA